MSEPLRLFPVPEPAGPITPDLSAGQRLTIRNVTALAEGFHPATGHRLLDPEWGLSCRDCVHLVPTGRSHRTYWKCLRHCRGVTHGAATDVRVSWPACDLLRIEAP